jgi:hypothetical protein
MNAGGMPRAVALPVLRNGAFAPVQVEGDQISAKAPDIALTKK